MARVTVEESTKAPAASVPDGTVRLRLVCQPLPGRACVGYDEVCVAMQVGKAHVGIVPGDAERAEWETTLTVSTADGVRRWRGPAVHGPREQRFLYLAWLGRQGGAPSAMFRRAKLLLDAIPAEVITSAVTSGTLIGELGLIGAGGQPLCASVAPSAIRWSAG